jgi:hypothetical protein
MPRLVYVSNRSTSLNNNKYISGSGVGSLNSSVRRALARRSSNNCQGKSCCILSSNPNNRRYNYTRSNYSSTYSGTAPRLYSATFGGTYSDTNKRLNRHTNKYNNRHINSRNGSRFNRRINSRHRTFVTSNNRGNVGLNVLHNRTRRYNNQRHYRNRYNGLMFNFNNRKNYRRRKY